MSATRHVMFGPAAPVAVDGVALEGAASPVISADGKTLYWRDGATQRLRSAKRMGTALEFGPAAEASAVAVTSPVLSEDELVLMYSDGMDSFVSMRASRTGRFGAGAPMVNVNSPQQDAPLALAVDGCVLLLKSTRPGGQGGADVWEARRP